MKWQLIFLYIGRMGWEAGHLIIIVGTGSGAFAKKIARRAGHLTILFKCPGLPGGLTGGCTWLEMTRSLTYMKIKN